MNVKAIFFILLVFIAVPILTACGGIGSSANAVPTALATPTIDPLQSAKIVQSFWDALAVGDLDTAMTYIDDNASCAGYCYFTGKSAFRNYLQGYLEAGHITRISDVKNVGSIVTYTWEVYRNGNFVQRGDGDEIMHIEDGRIVYWENQHR